MALGSCSWGTPDMHTLCMATCPSFTKILGASGGAPHTWRVPPAVTKQAALDCPWALPTEAFARAGRNTNEAGHSLHGAERKAKRGAKRKHMDCRDTTFN